MSTAVKAQAPDDLDALEVVRRRSRFTVWWFSTYLGFYLRRNFHGVRVARGSAPRLPADMPVIVYTNHPSWWDPAMIAVLATRLYPDRLSYGPMDDVALGNYGFMRKIGIFGIDPATPRGAAAFLKTSLGLLASPRTILWITAEGEFRDARERPVRLRPGLAHLARRVPGALIVPLGFEYPFWDERTPEALVRFGAPVDTRDGRKRSVAAWNKLLEARLAETMDALAVDSQSRDPAEFEPLLKGRAGVGGIYDIGRRLRAWSKGERFRAAHGRDEA